MSDTDKNAINVTDSIEQPYDETYRSGPVIMRGPMIPKKTVSFQLLENEGPTSWLHEDPWRVLRIQSEFVDGFGALAELGPAISVFGSARTFLLRWCS